MIILSLLLSISSFAARPMNAPVKVPMFNGTGQSVGEVILKETKNGTDLSLRLENLSPGEHAIHFHEFAKCDGPDFGSAGGHFAHSHKNHGKVEGGPHEGDLPNFKVGADGKAKSELHSTTATMKSLRQPGASIVVHAKPDDYKTQPSGNSGDRVACGIIQ